MLVLLVGSALGAVHPLGDTLALFRGWMVPVALVVAAGLALVSSRRLAPVLAAVALGLGLPVALSMLLPLVPVAVPDLTLYQLRAEAGPGATGAVLDDIRAAGPDVVALQAPDAATGAAILDPLGRVYARTRCPSDRAGDLAIATRLPVVAGSARCEAGAGMVAVQVEGPEEPLWLVSLQLDRAFPGGQPAQLEALVPALAALEGPVIVAGRLNMAPWSHAAARIGRATGTRIVGPTRGTHAIGHRALRLPVDQVRAPVRGSVVYRAVQGTDAVGVLAAIAF